MALVEIDFDSREEADAFVMGIQYVNESSVMVVGQRRSATRDKYVVVLEDADVHWDTEDSQ